MGGNKNLDFMEDVGEGKKNGMDLEMEKWTRIISQPTMSLNETYRLSTTSKLLLKVQHKLEQKTTVISHCNSSLAAAAAQPTLVENFETRPLVQAQRHYMKIAVVSSAQT